MKSIYYRWYYGLLALIIFSLGTLVRFYRLDAIKGYYFDEVYHVPTAKMMAKHDQRAYEWHHGELTEEIQAGTYIDWLHPPLAKLLQATSMVIFGDNPWGWRFTSALMGSLLLLVIYIFARLLVPNKPWVAILALTLATIDSFAIAQSRIAMNDIHVTFFMTLGVLFYYLYRYHPLTKQWLLPLASCCGLAIASKWSGVFLLVFIAFWELLTNWLNRCKKIKKIISLGIFLACMSGAIYLLSYYQLFEKHNFAHFLELHQQIIAYQTRLDSTHPYASRAWEWPLGLKPVYLYLDPQTHQQLFNRPFYPSWFFALFSLLLGCCLSIAYAIGKKFPHCLLLFKAKFAIKRSRIRQLTFLLGAYFCFWIFWLFSPRIMFFYHYLPATPMIWLITALVVEIISNAYNKKELKQ